MKQIRLFSTLIGFALVALTACERDNVPQEQEPRYRIKRIDMVNASDKYSRTFTYRSDGKLANYVTGFETGTPIYQKTTLEYDAQGRLVTQQEENVPTLQSLDRVTYEYDAKGNLVVEKLFTDELKTGTYVYQGETRYEYDGLSTLPVKAFIPVKSNTYSGLGVTITFTYSGGNLVQVVTNNPFQTRGGPTTTETFQYDGKVNPYFSLSMISPEVTYNTFGRYVTYSKNNQVRPDYQLTYNANGLLTKRIKIDSGLEFSQTITYEQY